SRTVDEPEKEQFEEMIRRIVFQKLKAGQLDESGLTLTDLRILTDRLAATLVNMSHGRVKYPWQRAKEKSLHREPKPEPEKKLDEDAAKAKLREKLERISTEMPPKDQRSRPFELKRLTGEDDADPEPKAPE